MEKKTVIYDMILNIIATAIPTVVLQLVILPSMANFVNGDKYGLIVTILAVLNIIPSTVGNMLNNVRLLHEEDYKSNGIKGDFQILLILFEILNVVVMMFISIYYLGKSDFIGIILLIFVSVFLLGREYYIIAFRLDLNYISILLNNIFMVIGYLIGFLLFYITGYWQFVFLMGYVLSCVFILIKSDIIREPIMKTNLFKVVTRDTIFLIIATILSRAMNYADKILLYPLLGGTMVSIYYAATVFGKVVSLAITPINSVALSYLSKVIKKPDSLFRWTYVTGSGVCIIGYAFAVALSRPVLSILYPQFVDEAMKYIWITSATTAVSVLSSLITPFVLRYYEIKWQIIINGITTVGYIITSLVLLKLFNLMGLCIGALIANILKLIITTYIYMKNSAEKNIS